MIDDDGLASAREQLGGPDWDERPAKPPARAKPPQRQPVRSEAETPSTRFSWVWLLIVAVIVIIAGVLRFWELGAKSLWFDELFSANATMWGPSVAIKVTAQDTNPPLYYVLQALLIPWLGRTEWALRAMPAAIGVLTTGVMYLAGRKLFDRATGAWAAAMFAVSALALQYAQEARMYSLLMLFAALTLWLFARLAEKPTALRAAALGVAIAGMAYTHVYGYMAAPLLLVPVLLLPRLRRRVGLLMLVTYFVAGVLFLPWALVIPTQVALVRSQVAGGTWWMKPSVSIARDSLANFVAFSPGGPGIPAMIFMGLLVAGLVVPASWLARRRPAETPAEPAPTDVVAEPIAAAGAPAQSSPARAESDADGGVRESDLLWVLAVFAVVPMLVGLLVSKYVTPIATTRNALVCLPAAYILAARGAAKLRWIGTAALALLLLFGALQLPVYYTNSQKGEWRQATEIVLAQPKTGVLTQDWETDFNLDSYAKVLHGGGWMHAMWVSRPNAQPSPRGRALSAPADASVKDFVWSWDHIYVVSMTPQSSVASWMAGLEGWRLAEKKDLGKPVMWLFERKPVTAK